MGHPTIATHIMLNFLLYFQCILTENYPYKYFKLVVCFYGGFSTYGARNEKHKFENNINLDETAHHEIYCIVGCFRLNGPLRQYFSLYRAISQREGERKEK